MTAIGLVQHPQAARAAQLERQLDDLRKVHSRLLAAIRDLDGIPRCALRDDSYLRARYRLSAASLARRRLWHAICCTLEPLLTEADVGVLSELMDGDLQLLRLSARHVGSWSSRAIEARWPEYCRASRDMRGNMAAAIGKEQRLLYPLLENYARMEAGGAVGNDALNAG